MRACTACAASKRKCGKQSPQCVRCRRRGTTCRYPPAKPSSFVLCLDEFEDAEVTEPAQDQDNIPVSREPVFGGKICPFSTTICPLHQDLDYSSLSPNLSRPFAELALPDPFGLSNYQCQTEAQPENNQQLTQASSRFPYSTWKVTHPQRPCQAPSAADIQDMKSCIVELQQWLKVWVESGSNPFVHSHLYSERFPSSVQDAYLVLSAYIHKTPGNEFVIFRLIEDRARRLMVEHGEEVDEGAGVSTARPNSDLGSLEHLARCHALLVYQTIGLYDGDIRLRHISESRIPILDRWMSAVVAHASLASNLGGALSSPSLEQRPPSPSSLLSPTSHTTAHSQWKTWILTESIRRTWVIAAGIQGVYQIMKNRRMDTPCNGGMMFTTQRGVWEAGTALEWEKLCVDIELMPLEEPDDVLAELTPGEINDFTKVVLQTAFGVERMRKWMVSS
ncbi:hypothetical protein F5Y18DRAFT_414618 [Xylariaceae sp. FL1019]|nr:hypothetical protein F5Y18DRAFT_414618 [Xylariaceae sp. FL1019]